MKITNEMIQEYKKLDDKIKEMESRKAELAEAMKSRGSFSTDSFVVSVEIRHRTALAGLKEVEAVVGRGVLDKNGLIRTTEYRVISIGQKEKRAA